jgi:hypothetical protein
MKYKLRFTKKADKDIFAIKRSGDKVSISRVKQILEEL